MAPFPNRLNPCKCHSRTSNPCPLRYNLARSFIFKLPGCRSSKTFHSASTRSMAVSIARRGGLRNHISYSVLAKSYLKCLAKCSSDETCMSASYDRSTRKCDISPTVVTSYSQIYLEDGLTADNFVFIPAVC